MEVNYPKEELKLLQKNLIYYVFILFCIGIPLWWVTTSPYRAALQSLDPTISEVKIPVNLSIHYEDSIKPTALQQGVQKLGDDNPEIRLNSKLIQINGRLDKIQVQRDALNVIVLSPSTFAKEFPDVKSKGRFTSENVLVVKFTDADSLFALISRVLGTERLKSITDIELQVIFVILFGLIRVLFRQISLLGIAYQFRRSIICNWSSFTRMAFKIPLSNHELSTKQNEFPNFCRNMVRWLT
jgi:hypothetical protein